MATTWLGQGVDGGDKLASRDRVDLEVDRDMEALVGEGTGEVATLVQVEDLEEGLAILVEEEVALVVVVVEILAEVLLAEADWGEDLDLEELVLEVVVGLETRQVALEGLIGKDSEGWADNRSWSC